MTELATERHLAPAGVGDRIGSMYYGGEWHEAIEGGQFDDFEPYSGCVFARVEAGGPKDAAAAITAAD